MPEFRRLERDALAVHDAQTDLPSELLTGLLVLAAAERLKGHLRHRAAELDLTPQEADVLLAVDDGPPTMAALGERTSTDAGNLSRLVSRLETRGLVRRSAEDGDRRVRRIELTPAGERLHQTWRERLADGLPVLGALTERQQRDLRRLLARGLAGDAP